MEFSFRSYMEIYDHEHDVINGIHRMQPIDQALKDIDIHDKALEKGVFNGHDSEFLTVDKKLKQRFIDILKAYKAGEKVNPHEVEAVKRGLDHDKNNHIRYLDMQESPVTGSHQWHQTWIEVYVKWIELLNQLGARY